MQTRAIAFFAIIAAILACGTNEKTCGTQCYDPTSTVCVVDQYTNNNALCPSGNQACNGGCFLPSAYHCVSGQLQGGPAPGSSSSQAQPAQTTSTRAQTTSSQAQTSSPQTSSTKAPTTSAAQAQASSSSTKAPTTSSQAQTTSAAQAQTTSAKAQTTSSSTAPAATSTCDTTGCGTACNCNGACYTAGQYNCAVDQVTGKNQLCQGNYASCNGNCFDSSKSSCTGGSIAPNGAGTPSSSTYPPPVVPPAPSPSNRPTQTADLRVINSCKTTLWVEGRYGGQGAPIPGQQQTSLPVGPGGYVDYTVPDTGLSGSRFWAKYGCDAYGKNCLIGDAMQYWPNPPGGCPAGGCTPPIDSLFEATWGCRPGASCNSQNPTTWFDTSQVDGWTIPYKLTPNGDTSGCDSPNGFSGVDASRLDLAKCPSNENLVAGGQTSANVMGNNVSLSSVDLRVIKNNTVIGCMSPCKRLNWGMPYGLQQDESSGATMWMCCPTPVPDPSKCQTSQGCVTSAACRAGPIENTKFVAAVHSMAPGVYSYSYDDGVGLHACPAGVVTYTMEFCPSGSTSYPLQL